MLIRVNETVNNETISRNSNLNEKFPLTNTKPARSDIKTVSTARDKLPSNALFFKENGDAEYMILIITINEIIAKYGSDIAKEINNGAR